MRFLGTYDTIPLANDSDTYRYQQDFGFLRDDGLLIISAIGTTTDGASIPKIPPIIRFLLGDPLSGDNKMWASPHDALYRKCAVMIDCSDMNDPDIDYIFINWREIDVTLFRHQTSYTRKFADETLLQAMKCCGENICKRWAVYHAVRKFGRGWWKK